MYGYSVSISGDFLAVGSPNDNFEYKSDQGNVWRAWRRAKEQQSIVFACIPRVHDLT